MKHRNPQLVFFSVDPVRVSAFEKCVSCNNLQYTKRALFTLTKPASGFSRSEDLLLFLNSYKEDYQSLHVIVDMENAEAKFVRQAILSYPEVQFLFDKRDDKLAKFLFSDENDVKEKYGDGFPTEDWEIIKERICWELLEVEWEKWTSGKNQSGEEELRKIFTRIICGWDNTFDASNLRYALKYWKYVSLKVDNNRNFKSIQDSRAKYLAVCIEDEANQAMFNSYALYQNGFRVLPITYGGELDAVNNGGIGLICRNSPENAIVVRDYDLQFEDEGNDVDKIRGWKHCDNPERRYQAGWNYLMDDSRNTYWNNLSKCQTFYITKGPDHAQVVSPRECGVSVVKGETLNLVGLEKPINGVFCPFHSITPVKTCYLEARQFGNYNTNRRDHDHSTALDVYETANNMLKRAEKYYDEKRFRLSALISEEAMEVLNGFHRRLMTKALYLNAVSENAIAIDAIGGDDRALAEDAIFRIEKVVIDVQRLYRRESSSRRDAKSVNVLNQIFSDCRKFCKDKEHFEAEAAFISAMGHLNEGFPPSTFKLSASSSIARIKGSIEELHEHFTNRFDEELQSMIESLIKTIKKEEASIYLGRGIFIYTQKQLIQLNKHKRRYKRLSGMAWRRTGFHIIQHQVELGLNTKKKLVLKHHRLSLFERIKWESADSSIASFRGGSICANNTGETTLIAKMNNTCLASIKIVVRSNKEIENVKTSNKG